MSNYQTATMRAKENLQKKNGILAAGTKTSNPRMMGARHDAQLSSKQAPYTNSKAALAKTPANTSRLPVSSNKGTLQKGANKSLVTGNWLQQQNKGTKNAKGATKSGGKRKLNTDSCGFDGSVLVPKPSALFTKGGGQFNDERATSSLFQTKKPFADTILAKQRELAQARQEKGTSSKLSSTKLLPAVGGHQAKSKNRPKGSKTDALFGSLGDIDPEKVMQRKSHFASEAEAEEYAQSRRAVLELEQKEAAKEKRSQKQKTAEARIHKEWICQTCKRTFRAKPTKCIGARHNVSIKRNLQKEETRSEKRFKQSSKEGGLVLGSGIEWTKYAS